MKKTQAVAIGVIFDKNTNKFLLTHRSEPGLKDPRFNNCWNFPGGGVEFGETPEKAVVREFREELGIKVTVQKTIPKVFSSVRNQWHGILICYICNIQHGTYTIILDKESNQYNWFTLREIKKLHTLPLAYEIAKEASKIIK